MNSPNLQQYAQTCATFSWENIRTELLEHSTAGNCNMAWLAVDRHAVGSAGERPAICWCGSKGEREEITYRSLSLDSSRFANVLETLQIAAGEIVCTLAGRSPLLYTVCFGTFKHRNVFCPLFATFGPEPVYQRLHQGSITVLVTTNALYNRTVKHQRGALSELRHILLLDADQHQQYNVWSLPRLLESASPSWTIPPTSWDDPALLHFTSGTTAMPKGALHVHEAALTHYMTGKYVLDFHPEDRFWCTADPGWVLGTTYAVIAPLLHGITTIFDQGEFDAGRWLDILHTEQVAVLYTSPSALRRLQRVDESNWQTRNFPYLRAVHCAGEPLAPETVKWGRDHFHCSIHDNWWQTETGGIMVANTPGQPIKPGSMGRPVPGIKAAIVSDSGEDISSTGRVGMLAIEAGWPSMFRGYIHDSKRYDRCFCGQWYLSGDLAAIDLDGYFWFKGRVDDIIKTAGHMVGPFEVEAVLVSHPAVAEAAVYGIPDALLGERVAAAVVLEQGSDANDQLQAELIGYARQHLGPAIAPRTIVFVRKLPKNNAGKIMRRLLRTPVGHGP